MILCTAPLGTSTDCPDLSGISLSPTEPEPSPRSSALTRWCFCRLSLSGVDDKFLYLVVVPFEQVFVVSPRSVVLPILEDLVIHTHVLMRHTLTCEIFLYLAPTGAPVECVNPAHCLYGLIHIVNNKSRTAIANEFRH